MQLLLNSFLILCLQFCVSKEKQYDEVRMYIYTEHFSLGFEDECNSNENSIRVNASIYICIKDKNEIDEINNQLLVKDLKISPDKHIFKCQMLIDFISRGRIEKSVAISSLNELRIDEDKNFTYVLEGERKDFYLRYIKFFRDFNE